MWPFTSYSAPPSDAAFEVKQTTRKAAIEWAATNVPDVAVEEDLPILSATVTQLQDAIKTRKWPIVRILEAFIRSAVRSHQSCNNLTEILFEQAHARAKEQDAQLAAQGDKALEKKPLFGIPISIKDQLAIEGVDTSIGFSQRINKPATKDAAVVEILKHVGAIPFVKTNVPQTMLSFECQNPVFGCTTNPYSSLHTSGGSSGGEAALLGSDGSPIGIGSDIGGSCRIPASYSGCYGLKPCFPRIPKIGVASANPGFEGIKASLGPMARSMEDLDLLFRVIVDNLEILNYHRTADCIPLPYREIQLPKRLRIGYWKSDRFCKSAPAVQRAVSESVAALEKAGHECVAIDPPDILEAMRIFVALTGGDGFQRLLAQLHGDKAEPHLFLIRLQSALGPTWTHFSAWLSSFTDPISSSVVSASGLKPVADVIDWQDKRNNFSDTERKRFFDELKLDAIVSPVQASPAVKCTTSWNLAFLGAATVIFNVIDSAVTVVPVTQVDPELDQLTDEWRSQPSGSMLLEKALYSKEIGQYDPSGETKGLPVGVQISCGMYEEEKSLKIATVLDQALGPRQFGPGKFASRPAVGERSAKLSR